MTKLKRKKKHRALPGRKLGRPVSTHCGARQKRPAFSGKHPLLVTVCLRENVPSLSTKKGQEIVSYAIEGAKDNGVIVKRFKIFPDRIQMIIEAKNRDAFFRAMKSFSSRLGIQIRRLIAENILKELGHLGIFRGRYEVAALKTPAEIKNAFKVKLETI